MVYHGTTLKGRGGRVSLKHLYALTAHFFYWVYVILIQSYIGMEHAKVNMHEADHAILPS